VTKLLINAAQFLSLLLAVATAMLWIHTLECADAIRWRVANQGTLINYRTVGVISTMGGVEIFWSFSHVAPSPQELRNLSSFRGFFPRPLTVNEDPVDPSFASFRYFSVADAIHPLGFYFDRVRAAPRYHATVGTLSVPFWFVLVCFAIAPAMRLMHELRRRSRGKPGLCAKCGYDLRASSGQCPECGTPNVVVVVETGVK
jgi:hypothetical protein